MLLNRALHLGLGSGGGWGGACVTDVFLFIAERYHILPYIEMCPFRPPILSFNHFCFTTFLYVFRLLWGNGKKCHIDCWQCFITFAISATATIVLGNNHRVERVPGFLSSRPKWLRPSPSPIDECCPPPPLWFRGGGVQTRWREQTLWYSRYNVITLQ